MLSKKHIKDELSSNRVLISQLGITKIGLFGSYSRQEQKKDSDIDILVDFQKDKETFDNFMAVCDLLDSIFKGYKVEVVTASGLSPYIGPHILNEVEWDVVRNKIPEIKPIIAQIIDSESNKE